MSRFTALAVTVGFLSGCSKGNGEIERRVHLYCSAYADDLNKMVDNYQKRLKVAQTTTLSEEQATYSDVTYHTVGREGREERGRALEERFLFCVGVKNDDAKQIELRNRFAKANQTYVEAGDLTMAANAASEMAACVNDVQKLEIRHD